MDRLEEKMSIAARASRDAAITAAPILGTPLEGSGDFSIGGSLWPGISKLIEEAGEVIQVAGKLLGSRGAEAHWDGSNLRERLEEEIADLLAACIFVVETNELDRLVIDHRAERKLALFQGWHTAPDDTGSERSEHRDVQTNTSLHSEEKEETR